MRYPCIMRDGNMYKKSDYKSLSGVRFQPAGNHNPYTRQKLTDRRIVVSIPIHFYNISYAGVCASRKYFYYLIG